MITQCPPQQTTITSVCKKESTDIYLFLGDSITAGVGLGQMRSWPELIFQRVQNVDRYAHYVNAAEPGSTVDEGITAHRRYLSIAPFHVVSIAFGTNDAKSRPEGVTAFYKSLHTLVDEALSSARTVILHTPTPVQGDSRSRRPNLPSYAELVRSCASLDDRVILVDHYREWSLQPLRMTDGSPFFADPTHPSSIGHAEMAKLVWSRIFESTSQSVIAN